MVYYIRLVLTNVYAASENAHGFRVNSGFYPFVRLPMKENVSSSLKWIFWFAITDAYFLSFYAYYVLLAFCVGPQSL